MPIKKNLHYFEHGEQTVGDVAAELAKGLHLLHSIDKPLIGFFGSHITEPGTPEYEHAKAVAEALGRAGYGSITGGGPGIMHAVNSGAKNADVPSIGMRMSVLRNEHVPDHPYTHTIDFHYMMIRRFIMSIKSEALIFYPGGFGTLNELFEYVVLMQTGLTDTVPAILVNREFWQGMLDWVREELLSRGLLSGDNKDLELLQFADTTEEILDLVLATREQH